MDSAPTVTELGKGRIHAHHGPIDLLVTVEGTPLAMAKAVEALRTVLTGLLESLVAELDVLRSAASTANRGTSPTARRMTEAVSPIAELAFVTPMAAVAGSVADTVCDAMWRGGLRRLIVNNGGDVAFRLAPNEAINVALGDVGTGGIRGGIRLGAQDPVRGVATSGRSGRSLTMGIADSVTVLAPTAAAADAAATVIASSVDLPESPRIVRRPAIELDSASDLGARPVVVGVAGLTGAEERRAVALGQVMGRALMNRGLLTTVVIRLGQTGATVTSPNGHLS